MRTRGLTLACIGLMTAALPGCPGGEMADGGADVRDARRDSTSSETGGQDVQGVDTPSDTGADQGLPDAGVDAMDAGDAGSALDAMDAGEDVLDAGEDVLDAGEDVLDAADAVDATDATGMMDVVDVALPDVVDVNPPDAVDVPLSDAVPLGGTLVFLGTGGATVWAGAFTPTAGWTLTDVGGASDTRPAVAMTTATTAVGLIRSRSNGGELLYLTYDAGTWSPFAPLGAGITTRAEPSITSDLMGRADAVFHGDDFKHYFASYSTTWSPAAEPVGPVGNQSFGPSPATITESSAGPVVAFAGNNQDVFDQARVAGLWQGANAHGVSGTVTLTPTVAAVGGPGGLMLVWVRQSDAQVMYSVRATAAGPWSAPQLVPSALSTSPVSLVGLADGGAAIAFRGLDGNVYAARYTPTGAVPWSAPVPPPRSGATPSQPALAAGVGTAAAELIYAGTDGVAYHCRMVGASWNNCTMAGGVGIAAVAAASAP